MLYPTIIEVSTDKATGETYVLVKFWKTKAARGRRDPPFLVNDFVMVLRPTGDRDLRKEIIANISGYVERAEIHGYEGDHSTANAITGDAFFEKGKMIRSKNARVAEPRERDESDPHGVLAKPDVGSLPGDIDLPSKAEGSPWQR
jgi:hypothetical protein